MLLKMMRLPSRELLVSSTSVSALRNATASTTVTDTRPVGKNCGNQLNMCCNVNQNLSRDLSQSSLMLTISRAPLMSILLALLSSCEHTFRVKARSLLVEYILTISDAHDEQCYMGWLVRYSSRCPSTHAFYRKLSIGYLNLT